MKKKAGVKIKSLGYNGSAGCELTWEYLFPNEKMLRFVKLLGSYDVWCNDDKKILMQRFQHTILKPKSSLWASLDDSKVNNLVKNGKAIVDYLTEYKHCEKERIHYRMGRFKVSQIHHSRVVSHRICLYEE